MLELRSMVQLMMWTTSWRSFYPFCPDHQLVGGIQRCFVMGCYACLMTS